MAYQVIGIGNAVMDVISTAADAQLDRLGVQAERVGDSTGRLDAV